VLHCFCVILQVGCVTLFLCYITGGMCYTVSVLYYKWDVLHCFCVILQVGCVTLFLCYITGGMCYTVYVLYYRWDVLHCLPYYYMKCHMRSGTLQSYCAQDLIDGRLLRHRYIYTFVTCKGFREKGLLVILTKVADRAILHSPFTSILVLSKLTGESKTILSAID